MRRTKRRRLWWRTVDAALLTYWVAAMAVDGFTWLRVAFFGLMCATVAADVVTARIARQLTGDEQTPRTIVTFRTSWSTLPPSDR